MRALMLLGFLLLSCHDSTTQQCKDALTEYTAYSAIEGFVCGELLIEAPRIYGVRKCNFYKSKSQSARNMVRAYCE